MPLYSDHITNMYYSGSPSYTSVPYGYSSSVSPLGSSYSASYLNPGGNYSSHSSMGGYSRTPLTPRWIPGVGRSYSPMLGTISERSTASPVRINSPRRIPITKRSYGSSGYTVRPININTADIDVSRDKYRQKVGSADPPPSQQIERVSPEKANGPFMPRVDGKPETGIDSSPGIQRSTIKRGRTVVRLHTIKRKERDSPRKQGEVHENQNTVDNSKNTTDDMKVDITESINDEPRESVSWRERLSEDLVYKDKKEKKTLGTKLAEKFMFKDTVEKDSKSAPIDKIANVLENMKSLPKLDLDVISSTTSKSPDRRCSVELLAEQAKLFDSLIRRENLSTATLDLSKIGVDGEIKRDINSRGPIKKSKSNDQINSLKTINSDHSLFKSLKSNEGKGKKITKKRSLKKSMSGGSICRLDSITEFPKEPINLDLTALKENKPICKNENPIVKPKPKLKTKITSSVEVSTPPSPLKFRIENVTVEEIPRIPKKEIIYSSEVDDSPVGNSVALENFKTTRSINDKKKCVNFVVAESDIPSPEPDDGNFWNKIGKRETIYLMKRKQNIEENREKHKRELFWFPEDDECSNITHTETDESVLKICSGTNENKDINSTNASDVPEYIELTENQVKQNECNPTKELLIVTDKSHNNNNDDLKTRPDVDILLTIKEDVTSRSKPNQIPESRIDEKTEGEPLNVVTNSSIHTDISFVDTEDKEIKLPSDNVICEEKPESKALISKVIDDIQTVNTVLTEENDTNNAKAGVTLEINTLEGKVETQLPKSIQKDVIRTIAPNEDGSQKDETTNKILNSTSAQTLTSHLNSMSDPKVLNNKKIVPKPYSSKGNNEGKKKTSKSIVKERTSNTEQKSKIKTNSEFSAVRLEENKAISNDTCKLSETNKSDGIIKQPSLTKTLSDEQRSLFTANANVTNNKLLENAPTAEAINSVVDTLSKANIISDLSVPLDSKNIPIIENEVELGLQEKEIKGEFNKAENISNKTEQEFKRPTVKMVELPPTISPKKPVKQAAAIKPLIATPRPLQKKPPQIIHSSDSSESSSEEETSDEDEASEASEDSTEFFECESTPDGRTSTGSNDSGFDSSAPTSPASFLQIKKGGDNAGTSSSSAPHQDSSTDILEQELEQSMAYGIFRKTGRFTPPARSIPRFRKYTIEDFQFIKVLGKGSFGKVLLAELRDTEYYYAVKCLKKDVVLEDDDVECTLIERKVLALGTNHPYLCHLFATFQTDSHLFFVMEYLNGGDLMFHIQQSGRFPEVRARFYGAEIVSGLKFLHKRGIIYRDLKLDNILLDFDGHVRIADFGMCKLQIYLDKTADTFCGTPDYMAPEIIKGLKYNQTVDWWSFGVLLYEMLIGQSPFSGCDEDELFWSICNEMPSYPRFLSQEALTILTRLLDKDARSRLGGTECMHGDIRDQEFFQAIHWDRLERRELEAPFRPRVRHPLDTQYFDRAFTGERPRLTAVEPQVLRSMDQEPFRGFSYTNPNATDR